MDFLDYREKLGISFNDKEKYKYLQTRLSNFLNTESCFSPALRISEIEYINFCNTVGIEVDYKYVDSYLQMAETERFKHCRDIILSKNNIYDLLAYYIAFVNSYEQENCESNALRPCRKIFIDILCMNLLEAHIQYDIFNNNGEYYIFPKGVPELDQALVSEPLTWLHLFPSAEVAWVKALKAYAGVTVENASEVADQFRKTLETFLQSFFSSEKSLENLISEYGKYLEGVGIPGEIRNNFEKLLKQYCDYMNNYAKHHDKASINILEYIMYQTGNIMRLLLTLKMKNE